MNVDRVSAWNAMGTALGIALSFGGGATPEFFQQITENDYLAVKMAAKNRRKESRNG